MFRKFIVVLVLSLQFSGCATTEGGRGFDLIDNNDYANALPFFESAAQNDGDKVSAIMASLLHLSDYQIPRDIHKAKEFYELAKSLDNGPWGEQYLEYFLPLVEARINLYDGDTETDKAGTNILRGSRYSEHSPSLRLLAKAYAFGKGVDKNFKISKLLFERAIEHDQNVYSAHGYAWWLVNHPDERFRNGELAAKLMERVLQDETQSAKASELVTLAAIHAENGDFENAIKVQNQAISALAAESEIHAQLSRWENNFNCRLKTYENKQAWHYKSNQTPFSGTTESHACKKD